jgi:hypothetical protein
MKKIWLWSVIALSLLFTNPVYGMELCSMMGGKCQKSCTTDQYAESGVFEDCKDDQECCVQKSPTPPSKGTEKAPDSGVGAPVVRPDIPSAR